MNDSIKDRVLKVIDKQLNKDTSQIKLSDRFIEDLGADSLDRVELVMALEDEFSNLEIPDKEAETVVGFAIGSFFQEPESEAALTFELTLKRLQTITELSRRKETFVSEYF